MHFTKLLFLFTAIFFLIACNRTDNTRALELREKSVLKKEQELASKERTLKIQQVSLLQLKRVIDSLNGHSDTVGTYDPKIVGKWTIMMECIETNCEGSAIGDSKTEQWNIYYKGNRVIINALANEKLIRIYSGLFQEGQLSLTALNAPDPETHMDVILKPHPTKANLMEGERIINQLGKCKIVYRLKAEKL